MNYLNTDNRLFLIEFLHMTTEHKFICGQDAGFMEILKKYDRAGVKSIKVFNPVKNNFKRISKADILNFFSWDTEIYIYLKDHYYFK